MRGLFLKGVIAATFAVMFVMTASAQSVSGSLGKVTKGKPARATVYLTLPGGLHANSNRPNSEYAIPTTVRATSIRGVRIGAVSYPRGQNRKFGFSEAPINVYEGKVPFGFNVTVPATFKGQSVRVTVTVKYQACTNEVCYAPKSKTVTLNASVQ